MRHFLPTLCLLLALLLGQATVQAQPKHGFSYRYTFYNFFTPQADNPEWSELWSESRGHGAELAYQNRIFYNGFLVIPVKFGVTTGPFGPEMRERSHFLGSLDALLQYQLFKYGNLINPYLHAGVGGTYDFDAEGGLEEFDFNVPVGLGFNIRLMEGIYLNPQTQYRFSPDDRTYWQHGVGFTAFFGDNIDPRKPRDKDKDGIPDITDRCIDVFGMASAMGCPDRDGDSVADTDDKCPDLAGLSTMMGCPDGDADGIADPDDACPTEKGIAAFQGCPDTDNDGLANKDDKCPNEAGPAATGGCPDRDNDSILDSADACPDNAGPIATRGCPDRDADGVADRDDACPDKRGDAMHKGCPDTDGDGVFDNDDRCVDRAGPASNRGCPEMKKEDRAKIDLAVKAVQYETGKAVLLPNSKKILDDVAAVLLRYPEYTLNIGGHTDNVGSDEFNRKLSEDRAHSVQDYLASKGVPLTRMTHAGYGESKPISDNKTAAGRANNRRTEFDLVIK